MEESDDIVKKNQRGWGGQVNCKLMGCRLCNQSFFFAGHRCRQRHKLDKFVRVYVKYSQSFGSTFFVVSVSIYTKFIEISKILLPVTIHWRSVNWSFQRTVKCNFCQGLRELISNHVGVWSGRYFLFTVFSLFGKLSMDAICSSAFGVSINTEVSYFYVHSHDF